MIEANIEDGDLLVIDRSIESINGEIAVCIIVGEFKTVARQRSYNLAQISNVFI